MYEYLLATQNQNPQESEICLRGIKYLPIAQIKDYTICSQITIKKIAFCFFLNLYEG